MSCSEISRIKEELEILEEKKLDAENYVNPHNSISPYESYTALGAAVVFQACRDYDSELRKTRKNKDELAKLEEFFCSKRFTLFCKEDGEELMMLLRRRSMIPEPTKTKGGKEVEVAEDILKYFFPQLRRNSLTTS